MSDSTKTITEKKNIYSTRTLRYLRVSEKKVIPLLLYLRPEYTDWFNDAMFQEILITLHKHLPEKLALRKKKNISSMAVVDDKEIKGNLCVAEGYQFAYYLRPTDVRHSILFKEKSNEFPSLNKLEAKQKKSGKKRLSIQFEYEDDEEKESSGSEMDKEQYVKYTGFSIFRKTLVIVVEKLGHDFDFIDNHETNSKGQASSSELSSCPRYYQTTDNECDTRYQDTSKHPRSETPDSTAARTRRWRRESTPLSPTLLPISREQNESRGIQSFIYEQEEPRVFFLAETEARTSENISETRMHRESVPSPPPPSPQPPTTRSQSLSVRWSVPDENREEIEEEKLEEEDGESLEEALYRAYASETIAEMESRARLFRTLGEVFERDVIMGERVLDLYAERILSLWEPNFTISPQNPTSNHQFTTLKSYVKYILARARYPPDADDPVNVQLIQQQEVLSEWAWTNWASLKLMLALIYIERLRKMEPLFKGESGCSHRVFFAAFVVASKYVDISFARPRTQLQLSNDFKQNEEYYPEQEYESQTVPESEKKKEDELSELMGDSNKGNFNCGLIHEDEEQIRQSHVITLEEDNIEELLRNSRKVRHEDDYSDQDDIENREELLQNSVRVIHEDEELEEIMRNSYVLDDISVSNDNSAIYTNFPASSIPSNFNDSAQADSDYTNASDSDTSEYSSSSVDTILFMPNYHNSYYWSEMTNFVFPPDEITRMERDLLHMIDFHLRVASKDIIDCWRRCCLDERQIVPDKKYASPLVYRYREDELVINYDNEAPNFYVGGELGEGDATVPRWE